MGAKIEQLEGATRSSGPCGFLVSQPPELVLNGLRCRAEFGGDPAEHEPLRMQDKQPLDREGGPG